VSQRFRAKETDIRARKGDCRREKKGAFGGGKEAPVNSTGRFQQTKKKKVAYMRGEPRHEKRKRIWKGKREKDARRRPKFLTKIQGVGRESNI